MKYFLFIFMFLIGCAPSTPMTNKDIAKEIAYCRSVGLCSSEWKGGLHGLTVRIECRRCIKGEKP